MSTFRRVGTPSSSTLSEPRRFWIVPSSTTVTSSEATDWPSRPENAEVFLRLKSPSRPWPTASWSRMPGQPGPSTTVISPAGASTASSFMRAWRTASPVKRFQRSCSRKKSKATRPPPPKLPISRLAPSSTITVMLSRVSGRTSPTVQPEGVAIMTTTSSLPRVAMTWRTRGSRPRASASIRPSSLSLRSRSAEVGGSASV